MSPLQAKLFAVLHRYTKSRPLLWGALFVLVLLLLGALAFLVRQYEDSLEQTKLEQTAAVMVSDIRAGLRSDVHELQSLVLLHAEDHTNGWMNDFITRHRALYRLEFRDTELRPLQSVRTPYLDPGPEDRASIPSLELVRQACQGADRAGELGYAPSYFLSLGNGIGYEVMELCLPLRANGRRQGYLLATYRMDGLLSELIRPELQRLHAMSITELDGTRLSVFGRTTSANRKLFATELLDLPGASYLLRVDRAKATRGWVPNLLTAAVALLALTLLAVLYLLLRDVRKRQQVESDLAASLALRQAMEDALVTGLRARDLDGTITYVNPAFCRMVGLPPEVLLGSGRPAPYWAPKLVSEYKAHGGLLLPHDNPAAGFETEFVHADGHAFPVRIFEAPLLDAHGQQTGWMSTIVDMTEQNRMEELNRVSQDRLQATARLAMVGEMASLISHELNQPLAAISSYAAGSLNLLADPRPPDATTLADLREAATRIATEATRAGRVIKSVADFVRRRDRAREAVEVQALFDAVAPLLQLRSRKDGIELRWQVPTAPPPVWCDRTMVEQVLLNLARNGIQAMAQRATEGAMPALTLSAQVVIDDAGTQWVEFGVQDQGVGLSDSAAQQLFTPFFTTKAEGMGLGLSLCRTVVEQHGGRLRHELVDPNGTAFYFTLPIADPGGAP